jgi:hypothetical protein
VVEGELLAQPPDRVGGWCRLPEQTRARAEIEILVDSTIVAIISAGQASCGTGDSRYPFSLILPETPHERAACVIEARERGSGIVFGRVVWFEDAIAEPIERRLDALDVSKLKRPLAAVPADPAPRLRQCFSALGTALLKAAGTAVIGGDRAALARRMPRLPLSTSPVVSVIIPASPSIGTTLRSLAALQSLADTTRIEVIVADDGAEPLYALLQQACPQLRYQRDPAGLTGSGLNTLVGDARGEVICFLDHDPPDGDWHWPKPDIANRQVHLGSPLARSADWPAATRRRDVHGFALYLARTEIFYAGGFEPNLPAMDSFTDLAIKCRLLGAGITAWLCSAAHSGGS